MTEQQLAAIERRFRQTHPITLQYPAAVVLGASLADIPALLAEVRRLQAVWLVEKSRADRHEGELSVLRPAVARYATALGSIAESSNTSWLADMARAALAARGGS